jgi:4-hydroxy-tetrahydrodipicolinate synthase
MTSWEKVNLNSTADRLQAAPRGLICPLVTPLAEDGSIDSSGLLRLITHVGNAADAVLLSDLQWGEGLDLGISRRTDLMVAALEVLEGKRPIMVCVTGRTLEETRTLTAALHHIADRLGCAEKVYAVDYPLVYHGNRDLPRLMAETVGRRSFPLIIGNDPEPLRIVKGPARHLNIRTSVLKKLVRIPHIRAMIFRGSIHRSLGYQKAVRDRNEFFFYDADEAVFLNNPGMGGVVAGGSNLLPEPWKEITRSSLNRYDTERQFRSHQQGILEAGDLLLELHRLCRSAPAAAMKQILFHVGLIASDQTAADVPEPGQEWRARLRGFLDRWDLA